MVAVVVGLCAFSRTLWAQSDAMGKHKGRLLAILERQDNGGNQAVFIGINEFQKKVQLTLDYAVNDAVAMADVFVNRLGLIPPSNTILLLGGKPTPEFAPTLERLKGLGVRDVRFSATRTDIETAAETAVSRLADDGLLVISMSTHGVQTDTADGSYYVIPSGGDPEQLLKLVRVQELDSILDKKPSAKRLVFTDTCRTVVSGKGDDGGDPAGPSYLRAYRETSGKLVVKSCGAGQKSWENPDRKLGVFTGYLIDAFSGEADPGQSEYVTLHDIVRSADLAAKNKAGQFQAFPGTHGKRYLQQVNFQGTGEILRMPVARSGLFQEHQQRVAEARKLVAGAFAMFESDFQGLFPEITRALNSWRGPEFEQLLERIDTHLARPNSPKVRDFAKLFADSIRLSGVGKPQGEPKNRNLPPKFDTDREIPDETRVLGGKPVLLLGSFAATSGSITPSNAERFEMKLLEATRSRLRRTNPERLAGRDAFVDWKSDVAVRTLMKQKEAALLVRPVLNSLEKGTGRLLSKQVSTTTVSINFEVYVLSGGRIVRQEFSAEGSSKEFDHLSGANEEVNAVVEAIDQFLSRSSELELLSKDLSVDASPNK